MTSLNQKLAIMHDGQCFLLYRYMKKIFNSYGQIMEDDQRRSC